MILYMLCSSGDRRVPKISTIRKNIHRNKGWLVRQPQGGTEINGVSPHDMTEVTRKATMARYNSSYAGRIELAANLGPIRQHGERYLEVQSVSTGLGIGH